MKKRMHKKGEVAATCVADPGSKPLRGLSLEFCLWQNSRSKTAKRFYDPLYGGQPPMASLGCPAPGYFMAAVSKGWSFAEQNSRSKSAASGFTTVTPPAPLYGTKFAQGTNFPSNCRVAAIPPASPARSFVSCKIPQTTAALRQTVRPISTARSLRKAETPQVLAAKWQSLLFLLVYLLSLLQPTVLSAGEEDAIVPFGNAWSVNISAKYGTAGFTPEQSGNYTADLPWSLGLGVRYKHIAASLYLPSFYAFDRRFFESFDLQLASYYKMFYYEAFCKRYQDFTDGKTEPKSVDLRALSSGVSAGWVQNSKHHSLSAVYDLDSKQQSSNGSVILGFGVFYTSIRSGGTKCYRDTRRLVYFGPNIGYSYTFLFPGNIFLNMNLIIGLDAAINMNTNEWLFIPQATPRISFGHHGNAWSINAAIGCNYTAILWDMKAVDLFMPATMTLTYSKRF
jgi:hypothetical protein